MVLCNGCTHAHALIDSLSTTFILSVFDGYVCGFCPLCWVEYIFDWFTVLGFDGEKNAKCYLSGYCISSMTQNAMIWQVVRIFKRNLYTTFAIGICEWKYEHLRSFKW